MSIAVVAPPVSDQLLSVRECANAQKALVDSTAKLDAEFSSIADILAERLQSEEHDTCR
jgi:hypothetical protein